MKGQLLTIAKRTKDLRFGLINAEFAMSCANLLTKGQKSNGDEGEFHCTIPFH